MRRSRSSRTGPSCPDSGSDWACSSSAWTCRSGRCASRRSWSIAWLRAVVMIHPAGLGGSPDRGQVRLAAANASWTASSAMSMLPKTRTRAATARPYSARKTRSISVGFDILKRPHLDRQPDRPGRLPAPAQSRVQIGGVDDPESADVLLAFGVRPVGQQHLAVADPDDGGGVGSMQATGEDPGPSRAQLLIERLQVLDDRVHDLRAGRFAVGLLDAEQVAGHAVASSYGAISSVVVSYVAMMTPVVETTLSTSRNASRGPSGKMRRPWPRTSGWINR